MDHIDKWIVPLLFLALSTSSASATDSLKIAVFYGSAVPAKVREKTLQTGLHEQGVVVYSHNTDFTQAVEKDSIPLVIASAPFDSREDYEAVLQFSLKGRTEFNYLLYSMTTVDSSKMEELTIGAVEEVSHDQMIDFFKNKVGLNVKQLKTVSRPEDLFPLLVFKSADAIALAQTDYDGLRTRFNAKTRPVRVITNPISFPRLYIKKGASANEVIEKVLNLGVPALTALGFDGVERIQKL